LADKSGPKKPKMDRNSPEYKEKLEKRVESFRNQLRQTEKKRVRYALRQGFGERILGAYGYGEENFKTGGFVKGKLGLFADAINQRQRSVSPSNFSSTSMGTSMGTYMGTSMGTYMGTSMETSRTERQRLNPSISTIVDQLKSLISVANRIGAINEQQQNQLQQQLSQAARDSKEASMERGGTPISNVGGANLTPLAEEIGTLIEKSLKPFKQVMDDKLKEQEDDDQGSKGFVQRLAESYGFGDEYEDYTKRKAARANRIKVKPGYLNKLDKSGKMRYYGPKDPITGMRKRVKPNEAIQAAKPSNLAKFTGAAKNAGKNILEHFQRAPGVISRGIASRVGGARLSAGASSVTKNISSIIGKGVRRANVSASAAKNVGASTIKRVAGPIIKKALGSTVLKSIPIIGTAVGGIFAAKKLLEGDPVGAGLEAGSGLGGPMTAVPALAASVARDTYSSVFNVQPEQDPMFGKRMAMITGIIGAMITAYFASNIEKKPTPTKDAVDKAVIPPKPVQQQKGETPTGQPKVPPAPSPTPSQTPKPSASNKGSSMSSGDSKMSKAGKKPVSSVSSDEFKKSFSPEFMKSIAEKPSMVSSTPTTGADIDKMTAEVEKAQNNPNVIDLSSKRPLPSTSPPSKSGVSGAGNVPDPNYYGMGEIFSQIYFNPNPVTNT
jgi:hypothetical protein